MDENPYQSPHGAPSDLPAARHWHSTWLARLCLSVMVGGAFLPFVILLAVNSRPDLAPYLKILEGTTGISVVFALVTLWVISRRG